MASCKVIFELLFLLIAVFNSVNCEIDGDKANDKRYSYLIYPGTKWCGAGNIAKSYDDLGRKKKLDMCCREHDFCPDIIPAGKTKFNLTNTGIYTRLSCDCDEKFWKCLRALNPWDSFITGNTYFNNIDTKCFRKEYPVVGCLEKIPFDIYARCSKYKYDYSREKVYQWFDVKKF